MSQITTKFITNLAVTTAKIANSAVDLTTKVTGTLPIANGGTGAATTSQAFTLIGPTSGSGAPTFRALVSTDIPDLSATYLKLTGGSMTGAIDMGSTKITSLANGSNPNDAVNYSQLTALSTGLIWQQSINDPDLVNDSLSTPPGSPVYSITYIIAASPTGAWTGLAGHAVWYDGTQWIDLSTGVLAASGSGTAVQVGDRFAVAIASTGGPALIGGGLTGLHNYIVRVTGNTPGSFTYSTTAPVNNYALTVSDSGSQHYGSSFTYVTSSTSWVDFSGPSKVVAGSALAYTGNTLNVLYDNSTIGRSSNQLLVNPGGITNTQINSAAAIARSKIASGTNYTFVTNGSSGVMQDTAVTASRALVTDANGLPAASATTSTELGYVSGVTSAIQTQINGLANTSLSNLSAVALNANINPASDNGASLGTNNTRFNALIASHVSAYNSTTATDAITMQTSPASNIPQVSTLSLMLGSGATTDLAVQTPSKTSANSKNIYIATGNTTTSGNSGNITVIPGTAAGTRGKIQFQDGSQGTSGQVWTSTDANGSGQWQATASTITPNKETFVLSGTDITNQYIDLGHVAKTNSIIFMVKGAGDLLEGASYDYSVSYTGGAGGNTRVTFLNDLAIGGGAALVATDVVQVTYSY